MSASKRPVLIRSEMMIGFDVAPVAPSARFLTTRSGSIESSQSLVPDAISDRSGELMWLLTLWWPGSWWNGLVLGGMGSRRGQPKVCSGGQSQTSGFPR